MYEKLPEELKKDGWFCLWKYEERNGRITKVPYQINGKKASSADKNTFSDFAIWQLMQWMTMTESVWVRSMISAWWILTTVYVAES